MNEGWLCDSTLKATHQSSPISTTPAFSPGGTITRGPRVGRRFRCTRDDLYEQCSDHITLKTPSSVKFGSRPKSSQIRAYSSVVKLCCSIVSDVIVGSLIWNVCFRCSKIKQILYRVRVVNVEAELCNNVAPAYPQTSSIAGSTLSGAWTKIQPFSPFSLFRANTHRGCHLPQYSCVKALYINNLEE